MPTTKATLMKESFFHRNLPLAANRRLPSCLRGEADLPPLSRDLCKSAAAPLFADRVKFWP